MELEHLKILLEDRLRTVPAKTNLLASGARSVSALARIERNIKWEIAFASAFLLYCIINVRLTDALFIQTFLAILIIYTVLFLFQLGKLFRQSKNAINSTGPVKICVQQTITVVSAFMQLYERLTAWFLPLVFVAAMVAAFLEEYSRSGRTTGIPYFTLMAAIPVIAGWIWLMRRFSKWWLNRLYGQYLNMLFLQLKELTVEEGYP